MKKMKDTPKELLNRFKADEANRRVSWKDRMLKKHGSNYRIPSTPTNTKKVVELRRADGILRPYFLYSDNSIRRLEEKE